MIECLTCEKQYEQFTSTATLSSQYCSAECEVVFEASLEEFIKDSKIRGLVDADGNSILGNVYQQALARTIKAAASTIGIKLPSSTNSDEKE